jgi:Uma2 family endonuclease
MDEQLAKCQWYVDHGTQVALLVDPGQRSATVVASGSREVLSSPGTLVLLPGLELALDDIFSVLDA